MTPPNTTWNVSETSNFWGSGLKGGTYSSYNPMTPTQIYVGGELVALSGVTNPTTTWTNNQYWFSGPWGNQTHYGSSRVQYPWVADWVNQTSSNWQATCNCQSATPVKSSARSAGPGYAIPITEPDKTPAYTVKDVRTFVTAHPGGALTTVSGASFSINAVQFVTREQAEQMLHGESLQGQVAAGGLVCIVMLSGPFTGQAIIRPPGTYVRQWQPAHAVLVFDAHTGSLLDQAYQN